MIKLTRRELLLSSAALAGGAVHYGKRIRAIGRDRDASTAGIRRRRRARGDQQCDRALQQEISQCHGRSVDRSDLDGLGRLRDQGHRRSSTAGTAADVYGTAIETFQAFSSRGLWLNLNDFVAANSGFSDFAPSLFEQASYNGEVQYIPIGWNNIMINYNRDLFDKAGLPIPSRAGRGRISAPPPRR